MTEPIRSRREPPVFRAATVTAVVERSERLVRLTLSGPELDGFDIGLPASSVRLLVPAPAERASDHPGAEPAPSAIPTWNGNEFIAADGSRPPIRTLTPVRFDPATNELDVEVVLHGDGPLSSWVAGRPLGDPTAVSGTGRGYTIDPDATSFLLAGDESAIPAMSVLLDALPANATVTVLVEAVAPIAQVVLGDHPGASVRWVAAHATGRPGNALLDAITALPLEADSRVWAAGEAAGVHRIRQHLFEERSIPRAHAVVRGYWKVGRGEDTDRT